MVKKPILAAVAQIIVKSDCVVPVSHITRLNWEMFAMIQTYFSIIGIKIIQQVAWELIKIMIQIISTSFISNYIKRSKMFHLSKIVRSLKLPMLSTLVIKAHFKIAH